MIEGAPHEFKDRPSGCPDCGNSPVNHFESYISHTVSVWSSRSARKKRSGLFRYIKKFSDSLYTILEPIFFRLLAHVPGAHFTHDPSKARTYRSQVVWEEAARRGIRMEQLVFFKLYTDIYRARIRGSWRYFISIPIPPESSTEAAEWMDDKFILKEVLKEAGVPSPDIVSVTTLADARRAFQKMNPVVVKPRSGSRGRHTTVNVCTEDDLARAFKSAQKLCHYVAVEAYLDGGSVCRATVVGGKLVGFFQAHPPRILGNGRSTVSELIREQNAHKPERVQDIVLTDEHRRFIARQGYSETSVLPAGFALALTQRTGRLFGGYTRELLGREHPKLKLYAERAAAALGTALVGFDLIIPDPEQDPDAQRWGIIEANSLPYIDLHYLPLEGTPSNVAASVWDLWSKDGAILSA
jgi:D-alanine-D-alanine ligase-like ATP-grasp enzyme